MKVSNVFREKVIKSPKEYLLWLLGVLYSTHKDMKEDYDSFQQHLEDIGQWSVRRCDICHVAYPTETIAEMMHIINSELKRRD